MPENKEFDPRREAVALEYDPEQSAPTVVAAGRGLIAQKLIEKAEESGVPIYEDPDLAHTLNALGIGRQIPPELYQVVAQILVYVRDVDQKEKGKERRP